MLRRTANPTYTLDMELQPPAATSVRSIHGQLSLGRSEQSQRAQSCDFMNSTISFSYAYDNITLSVLWPAIKRLSVEVRRINVQTFIDLRLPQS
jgi:hypothetical protein